MRHNNFKSSESLVDDALRMHAFIAPHWRPMQFPQETSEQWVRWVGIQV